MEEEAEKLKALTEGVDGDEGEDAGEVDKRSIYVRCESRLNLAHRAYEL